jgi:hypothetical protein
MPQATPSARIVGRIQRLCLFGPGGNAVIPDLVRELSRQLPSSIGPVFMRFDGHFCTNSLHFEDPICFPAYRTYAQEIEGGAGEKAVSRTTQEANDQIRTSPVRDLFEFSIKVSWGEWLRSDYYNLVCKPMRWGRSMLAAVVGREDLLGALVAPRTVTDPAFTKRETRLLEAVVPYIAHALTDRRPEGPYVEGDERALVMVDENGAVQHASRAAQGLLLMARFPAEAGRLRDGLPEEVVRLCRRVASWSESNPLPTPPVWRHTNDWGEFVFRVFRMEQYAV